MMDQSLKKLIELLVDLAEKILPILIWQVVVNKIRDAEIARIKAELEVQFGKNKEKVMDRNHALSGLAALEAIIAEGKSRLKHPNV